MIKSQSANQPDHFPIFIFTPRAQSNDYATGRGEIGQPYKRLKFSNFMAYKVKLKSLQ